MVLTKTLTRISTLILIICVSACSSVAPVKTSVPTEERTQTQQKYEAVPVHEPENTVITPQEKPQTLKEKTVVIVPVSPTSIEQKKQSPAVIALLESAQQANRNGDTRSAQSSLQRAQRIAPRDPDVYYALANIHRDLQDYGLAEQVALKGVSIVQGQAERLRQFWLLIADIREEAGNSSGAKQARQAANRY